jgi:GT2 family glycosyltransferase
MKNEISLDISVVIINWNTKELLLKSLDSVYATIKDITFQVFVVDNASTDGSVPAAKKKFPQVNYIENSRNLGFAAANNLAFREMKGRYALLLNTDAILLDGAVEELFTYMEANPDAGTSCGQLLNTDSSKQNSIANFPNILSFVSNETVLRLLFPKKYPSKRMSYASPVEVESCIGACMMVRKEAMDEVGYFDESYFFFFEETDWAHRMKENGWKVCFVPTARIIHAQGKTAGPSAKARVMFYRSRYIYLKKWNPKSYQLYGFIIFARLLINTILSLLGIIFTLGLSKELPNRFKVYIQLILWHIKGCPHE